MLDLNVALYANTCCPQLFLNGKSLIRAGSMTPDHRYVHLSDDGRLAPRMVYQRRQREVCWQLPCNHGYHPTPVA